MTKKRKETSNEKERLERQLAELRAKYKDVSVMGKYGIKELTLIWEEKEYEPHQEEFEPTKGVNYGTC